MDFCNKELQEFVKKGRAREASLGEALDALKRSHEAGFIHVTYV